MSEAPSYLRLTEAQRRAASRATRLRRGDGATLEQFIECCSAVGIDPPQWVLDVRAHAEALRHHLPEGVRQAWTHPVTSVVVRCSDVHARGWGEVLGLWTPPTFPRDVWQVGLDQGLWTAAERETLEVLTPLGHWVRTLDRERRRGGWSRDALLEPIPSCPADGEPPVVEDGTWGEVVFKFETETGGPAWLARGRRFEALFQGRWVSASVAEAYAHLHGHRFRTDGPP